MDHFDRSVSSKLVFVSSPSKGTVADGKLTEEFLKRVAELQEANPSVTLISMMLHGYALLPYLKNSEATWAVWKEHCARLLNGCTEMWVLKFPGWDTSDGVSGEIELARTLKRPVIFIHI